MRRPAVFKLILTTLVAVPALALAADPAPDIKGKWVGKTHTIVAGSGGHWPTSRGTFDQPAFFERDLVIEITGQADRRFWGTTTIASGSDKTEEPFIGELTGRDNKKVVVADTDGFFTGELISDDTFSLCYMQAASGKTPASVVSCTEVKRTK